MGYSVSHSLDEFVPQPRCGYEWRTEAELFGLPLVHVAWGMDGKRRRLVARGIVAVGQYGYGGVVIAQFGVGVVCISQFGAGVLALSQFGIAVAAVAQIGAAVVGVFQIGVCVDGIGQMLLRLGSLL